MERAPTPDLGKSSPGRYRKSRARAAPGNTSVARGAFACTTESGGIAGDGGTKGELNM